MKILVFLIIFVFALSLFRMILEWSKNNNSSVESVDAVVSDKIGEIYQQQIPNAGDLTGSHGFTVHDIPNFKIKFRMTDYTEKEFDVDKKSFKNIKKDQKITVYTGNQNYSHRMVLVSFFAVTNQLQLQYRI